MSKSSSLTSAAVTLLLASEDPRISDLSLVWGSVADVERLTLSVSSDYATETIERRPIGAAFAPSRID
jgi:hypothetical protein